MPIFDWENNVCFVCGTAVEGGLHVRFAGDAAKVEARTVIGPPFQGFSGLVHGGILAGLADDAMWHIIHQQEDHYPVTAELTVRYHIPAHIGEPLVVRGELVSYRRRLMVARAMIENGQGKLVVSAQGRFMPLSHA